MLFPFMAYFRHPIISPVSIKTVITAFIALLFLTSCKTPKLSVANEQFERGEYFEAAKTYRSVYGKLKPGRTARCAGKWHIKWQPVTGG